MKFLLPIVLALTISCGTVRIRAAYSYRNTGNSYYNAGSTGPTTRVSTGPVTATPTRSTATTATTSRSTTGTTTSATSTTTPPVASPSCTATPNRPEPRRCGMPSGDMSFFTKDQFTAPRSTAPIPLASNNPSNRFRRAAFEEAEFNASKAFTKFSQDLDSNRIVGGSFVPDSRNECWQILLIVNDAAGRPISYCGGSIIGSQTILTAAHCIIPNAQTTPVSQYVYTGNLDVYFGAQGVGRGPNFAQPVPGDFCPGAIRVAKAVPHPSYVYDSSDNDIAILTLVGPVDLTSPCACPICLQCSEPQPGDVCLQSGYGGQVQQNFPRDPNLPAEPNPILLKVVPQLVVPKNPDNCFITFANNPDGSRGGTNLDNIICAGGQRSEGTCFGDSGGPFFCLDTASNRQYQAGMPSRIPNCGIPSSKATLYISLARYTDFILKNSAAGDVFVYP
ncbi:hypothetical protein RvY_16845 [Ramazzottius varieornatus]|uniref:Peptidase S1 domain-containing protein n=1 Tax=Ramazzottius varieornatus TaxID=947166 RepID=A0A1D1VZZ8_RAMVA|nr:hypothetical protein RvY_16845 [Ramazzottius varieornatus]